MAKIEAVLAEEDLLSMIMVELIGKSKFLTMLEMRNALSDHQSLFGRLR